MEEAEIIKQGVDKLERILRDNRVVVLPEYDAIIQWAKKYGVAKDTAYRYIWDFCETLLSEGIDE
jgi:hypothetical protein